MDICGCKFSKQAPYCDGETCVKLRNGEINKGENEQ